MKRGRLSRQGRIFRNFLLAGVLGALIWACAGWPVPAWWELRRLEREAFLSPHSQFQGSIQDSWGEELPNRALKYLILLLLHVDRQNFFLALLHCPLRFL